MRFVVTANVGIVVRARPDILTECNIFLPMILINVIDLGGGGGARLVS